MKKSRKRGQEATRFNVDAETGKMIIDGGDEANDGTMEVEEDVVGTAYRDSIRSIDGFSRGPNGRVKFNKDTKKRRREELEGEIEDIEMSDMTANTGGRSKKRSPEKVGKEFRSRVCAYNHTPCYGQTDWRINRKQEAISREVGWIHMHMLHSSKPPRESLEGLRISGELYTSCMTIRSITSVSTRILVQFLEGARCNGQNTANIGGACEEWKSGTETKGGCLRSNIPTRKIIPPGNLGNRPELHIVHVSPKLPKCIVHNPLVFILCYENK